ncbi:hypothetical protein DYB38_000973 [Aphanomyces astaci]|uniref:Uncharacterized protein n=2 Tax=Aphanomyces astaci TaxID=112090 RepID=A0A397CRU6_APHAT|nr:hypothetical protein DYB38_000973 [Aphanomyces astaci]
MKWPDPRLHTSISKLAVPFPTSSTISSMAATNKSTTTFTSPSTPRNVTTTTCRPPSSPTPTWQSNVDIPTRRTMIHKLLWVFQHKHQAMQRLLSASLDPSHGLTSRHPPPIVDARLPSLVRRLELALYLRAASLDEYLNEQSLHRRVQHLIVSLHHQTVLHFRAQEGLLKRPRPSDDDDLLPHTTMPAKKHHSHRLLPQGILFLNNQEHVLGVVFSFLDGLDVVRCMGLNRFAASVLPLHVRYLDLSWVQFTLAVQRCLQRFQKLERLAISPPRPSTTLRTTINECLVEQLAVVLPTLKNLQQLTLANVYIHTDDVNATSALCRALHSCVSLTHLNLSGNAIGDCGMSSVAALLPSLPSLVYLDLRRNYIGEGGMLALASILQTGGTPLRLHTLLLGSNIAANSVNAVAAGVGHRRLQHLRVLGLEDNFVDLKGVEALARVLQQGVCPVLQELCIGDNVVDNQRIRSVFAFAKLAKNND